MNSEETPSDAGQLSPREAELRLAQLRAEAKAAKLEAEALALEGQMERTRLARAAEASSAADTAAPRRPAPKAKPIPAAAKQPVESKPKPAESKPKTKPAARPQAAEKPKSVATAMDARPGSAAKEKPAKKKAAATVTPVVTNTASTKDQPTKQAADKKPTKAAPQPSQPAQPKPKSAAPESKAKPAPPGKKPAGQATPPLRDKPQRDKPQRDKPQPAAAPGKASPKAPQAPPVAARPPVAQPTDGAISETEPARDGSRFRGVPSWMVSAAVHMVLLLLLALWTVREQQKEETLVVQSKVSEEVSEIKDLEPMEFEVDVKEISEQSFDALTIDEMPLFANLGESLTADPNQLTDVDALGVDSAFDDFGTLFGDDGLGMSEIGGGKGAAMFFGVKTTGNRFCYVVDNSNSMNGGKFETAVYELVKSVRQLDKSQYFYVVFYSDAAYPLFYPEPAQGLVKATDDNKKKLEYWLMEVHRCLRTNGEEAMAGALALRPDVIYLLGDGAFGDKTIEKTLAVQNDYLTIHTLGFNMREKDAVGFQMVAKKFKGKFTDVKVPPEMAAISKRVNRPKNNTRNGVWGIKLPVKK